MPVLYRSMHSSCQVNSAAAKPTAAHGWRLARGPMPQARLGCLSAVRASFAQTTPAAGHLQLPALHFGLCGRARMPSERSHLHQPFAAPSTPVRNRTPPARPPAALPEVIASLAASPNRDLYVVAGGGLGAVIWVKLFDLLAANGTLDQKLSRKLVHTTTGPLFVLTWILFSAAPAARYLAAVVPLLNFLRLSAVGTGIVSDPGLVKSVSRSGDRGELLKGPLYYVVTMIAATVLCWRDNPAGLIAVSMMCGGDGLADIVGRRWGASAKLPYNQAKSWAGSVAMLVGGYIMSYGLILLFCELGFFSCYPPAALLGCLGMVALASTVVESLPINKYVDDNVSVPLVAAGLSMLLLPQPVDAITVAVAAAAAPMAELAVTATTAAAAAAATAAPVGLAL